MSDKDVAVPTTYRVPDGNVGLSKAWHLVCMSDKCFLASERPTMEPSHIQAKGFWVARKEHDVVSEWENLVKQLSENKKNIVEVYIPWHHIQHIRNLAYKAK